MRKPQGEGSAATSGLLIGLMFGFLVALGMFKQTLKSQRSDVFPYAVTIGVILAAVVGYLQTDIQIWQHNQSAKMKRRSPDPNHFCNCHNLCNLR